MSLRNRTVLVTGGASGIGRAVARAFAAQGAAILITDISPAGAAAAAEMDGLFLQADLASMEATRTLGQRALDRTGGIDILVNNAGLQHIDPVEDFPDEQWTRMLQIMLGAPFQLTKLLVPGMKERGWGRILNIASIHGLVASPFKSAYISAKHGLMGLTKTTALELGPYGITVNAICPGYTNTPLVRDQIEAQAHTLDIPASQVVREVMLEPAAIKRLVEPDEVAQAALYLASDGARTITGSSFVLDGGWTAR